MKRSGIKILSSIVAVLILFCSLPMGSVTAAKYPRDGDVSITFKHSTGVVYTELEEGSAFEDLVDDPNTKNDLGYSVTKTDAGDYKLDFETTYSNNTFLFMVNTEGDVTLESVTADYKNDDGSSKLTTIYYNASKGGYQFNFRSANQNQNSFEVSVKTSTPTYTVTAPADPTGYTFEPAGEYTDMQSDDKGEFKFSIKAMPGYKQPSSVKASGATVSAYVTTEEISGAEDPYNGGKKYTYTITGIKKDTIISYTGGKQTYRVSFDTSIHGYTLSPVGSDTFEYGGNFDFYVLPEDGYKSIKVSDIVVKKTVGDNVISDASVKLVNTNQYRLSGVTDDVTISLSENAGEQTYTISLPSGTAGYSVSVDEDQEGINEVTHNVSYTSKYNGNFKFKIEMQEGYTDSPVLVYANGIEVSPDSGEFGANTKQYTISNITANQKITVSSPTKNNYSVNLVSKDPNPGYTLTTTDSTSQIPYMSIFHFTLTLKDGYQADKDPTVTAVGIDDSVLVQKRTNSNVVYDCTVEVTDNITGFTVENISAIKYTVTADDKTGYTIKDANETSKTDIPYNGSYNFTVNVNPGYKLVSVAVGTTKEDGATPTNLTILNPFDDVYHINNITTNMTVIVKVEEVTLTVVYNNTLNKSESKVRVEYTVSEIKVNGVEDTSSGKYGSVSDGNVTLFANPENSYGDCYKFAGWYDEYNASVGKTRSLGNADTTLNLTAQWTPIWEEIFKLQWDNVTSGVRDTTMTFKYVAGDRNEVPDLTGAKITKVGMFLAKDATSLSKDQFEKLKSDFTGKVNPAMSVRLEVMNKAKTVMLYCFATSYEDLDDWYSYTQQFNVASGNSRSALGWIELTLQNGEKAYVYTDVKTLPLSE